MVMILILGSRSCHITGIVDVRSPLLAYRTYRVTKERKSGVGPSRGTLLSVQKMLSVNERTSFHIG
jgi:hypothetical protein